MLDAGAVNSDAAVVGLQAMHLLKGEWWPQLWGTTYQGSLDPILAALIFLATGPTPFGLYLVPLLGACAAIALWFDLLRRKLHPWAALACVMPLVIAPLTINMPMLIVLRQSLATMVCTSVWLCWRAASMRRGWPLFALSGALLGLSLWVDFFAVTMIPAMLVLGLGATLSGEGEPLWRRGAALAAGVFGGLLATLRLRHHLGGGSNGAIDLSRIGPNFDLLIHSCLPFTLGTKVFIKGDQPDAQPWDAPFPVVVLQWSGAACLVLLLVLAVRRVLSSSTPNPLRWLGLGGLTAACTALAGFVLSPMPRDVWSVRYLAPLLWLSPLWLAPATQWLTRRGLWVVIAPYLISTAIGGWLSWPKHPAQSDTRNEQALLQQLKADGVQAVAAEYWLAYRLTFLWREELIAMPLDSADDRHRAYRQQFDAAAKKALVFHPFEARAHPEDYAARLTQEGIAFTRQQVGGFTVIEQVGFDPHGAFGH